MSTRDAARHLINYRDGVRKMLTFSAPSDRAEIYLGGEQGSDVGYVGADRNGRIEEIS